MVARYFFLVMRGEEDTDGDGKPHAFTRVEEGILRKSEVCKISELPYRASPIIGAKKFPNAFIDLASGIL
jgi:hypothetical protein